jgi:hypothetical protein
MNTKFLYWKNVVNNFSAEKSYVLEISAKIRFKIRLQKNAEQFLAEEGNSPKAPINL